MSEEEEFKIAAGWYDAGDKMRAEEMLRRMVERRPGHAEACNLLGIIHFERGEGAAAADWFKRAITVEAGRVDYFHNLGTALYLMGRREEALGALQKAAETARGDADLLTQIARTMCDERFYPDALAVARRVLSERPEDSEALAIAGPALMQMGDFGAAEEIYRRVLEQHPDSAGTHWNLALLLLAEGRFGEGWQEFEWRRKFFHGAEMERLPARQWEGEKLPEGTLLVCGEGGFGDVIQYARYLPMAAERAGRLIFECQAELIPVFESFSGIAQIIARGGIPPACNALVFLPSLARIFGTDLSNIPAEVPYVRAPAERLAKWRQRVPEGGLKNVGLVWAGHGEGRVGDKRSGSLEVFAPLGRIAGVRLFSLQLGPAAGQAGKSGMEMVDLTAEIHDFGDTAALLEQMDLVISVDTSVAHLAGAMGRPVWVLLPFVADYRWLLERADSPWYPTMRLFRQTELEDWATPVAKIAEALAKWV